MYSLFRFTLLLIPSNADYLCKNCFCTFYVSPYSCKEQAVKLLKTDILKLPWLQQSVHMSIDLCSF